MKTLLKFALPIITFSAISLNANSNLNERIKVFEAELQKVIKSTYLPNDEQINRIKKRNRNAAPATIKGKYFMANPYNITARYAFNF